MKKKLRMGREISEKCHTTAVTVLSMAKPELRVGGVNKMGHRET